MSVLPYKDIMPKIGERVYIAPGAWVIGDVVIGDRSSIWFNTVVRADVHYIRIGSETNIQDNCSLHVTAPAFFLEIGNRVTVGHRAIVHGCVVEDDCLIGMGAIIMDGARIGRSSIVAAGAVVTPGSVVPPESIVVGSPAAVKKNITEDERRRMQHSFSHYLDLASDYLDPRPIHDATRVKGFIDRD
ncbi:MAG: gamma carbonic anhydrase family protein [Syntrophobacteraceae bacterium]|nr:gamma carbonic anhydrase family protein [Syntrophobacteraceae bacterium]